MQRHPTFKTSLISRLFGIFASTEFPSWIQRCINKAYVFLMHVDLQEFEEASSYKSLNKLFTRRFKTRRLFNIGEQTFIAPCDSFISAYGQVENHTALQIKGFHYDVGTLLSDYVSKADKAKLEGGVFINFYLSPRDYHRYHAPIDMQILRAVHIPGKLYPVNLTWLKKIQGLFLENERVVLECRTKEGKLFYMVFVGALNVGKMVFSFDASIQTNAKASLQQYYRYTDLHVKKGDELGHFEMGSTVVMLFESNTIQCDLHHMTHVKFGQAIGEIAHGTHSNSDTQADEQEPHASLH
jgi:phosphatidylserine decarboxylase